MSPSPTSDRRRLALVFLSGLLACALWSALRGPGPGDLPLLPCPFRLATDLPCPGCGMTRACVALAQGRLAAAWSLHPFAYLLVPLAACVALWPRGTRRAWTRAPLALRVTALGAGLATCLGLWLARLA